MMRLLKTSWLMKLGVLVLLVGLVVTGIGYGNDANVPSESDLAFLDGTLKSVQANPNGAGSSTEKDTLVVVGKDGKETTLSLYSRLAQGSGLQKLAGQPMRFGFVNSDIYSIEIGGKPVLTYKLMRDIETAANHTVANLGLALNVLGLLLTLIGIPFARRKIARLTSAA